MATFADRIKGLREEHHLTQQELASRVGTTKSAISMYERGARLVARLDEVENELEDLQQKALEARAPKPIVPEPIVRGWLQSLQASDLKDPKARKRLVSTFVAGVTVGPNEVTIAYNAQEKGLRCVRVDPGKWTSRSGTRTPQRVPRVVDGLIILQIKRASRPE